ncbi:MAG: DUF3263 domain-containing protein [Acidimicrobiia bacterium]
MLTKLDRAILDFERAWWVEAGPKDLAIELDLGLTAAAYYERLRALVGEPAALAYDPLTVKRVLRILVQGGGEKKAV